jgi:cell division septal protein FtsQ
MTMTRWAGGAARGAGQRVQRVPLRRAFSILTPLVALIALFGWFLLGSYWQTRTVRIQGTTDPALLALVRAQRLTGCDAFLCDFRAARQSIAVSPRAQQVSIQVVFPSTTLVRITPRLTTALWRIQGQTWAVGEDGVVIGAADHDPSLAASGAALVDDPTDIAFAGRAPQPGARMDAALVAMAKQLRMSSAGAGLDPTSLRLTVEDGFTLRAKSSGALVVFGDPTDAAATLADVDRASPAPEVSQSAQDVGVIQATPAQAAQGAQIQVEAAAALVARLAQSGASATRIDVRWGSHPYYR